MCTVLQASEQRPAPPTNPQPPKTHHAGRCPLNEVCHISRVARPIVAPGPPVGVGVERVAHAQALRQRLLPGVLFVVVCAGDKQLQW